MKLVKVITRQLITQTWEYEIEVDDDFTVDLTGPSIESAWDKIPYANGHCWDDDTIEDENIIAIEEIT